MPNASLTSKNVVVAGWVATLLVFLVGVFLRVYSFEPNTGQSFDEKVYGAYVTYLGQHDVSVYPKMVADYLTTLKSAAIVILPPTRVTFLLSATAWHKVFGTPPIEAVRAISCVASILTLAISGLFAARLAGWRGALGVTTLMAFAPTQVSMAHRAFIDGFFGLLTLMALWSLWEALRQPKSRWCWPLGLCVALLVLTKENAAFAYLGLWAVIGANRWAKFGEVSPRLLIAMVAGPLAGAALLALCAGGPAMLVAVYHQNVTMNYVLPYGQLNQDGPWFRYLTDLLLVSPAVMLFAIGGAFLGPRKGNFALFVLIFMVVTYVLMGHIRYGINLRFANMWDFPLRWLALAPVLIWMDRMATTRGKLVSFGVMVGALGLMELSNYLDIFVRHQVYDPVSINLMRALDMIK